MENKNVEEEIVTESTQLRRKRRGAYKGIRYLIG